MKKFDYDQLNQVNIHFGLLSLIAKMVLFQFIGTGQSFAYWNARG